MEVGDVDATIGLRDEGDRRWLYVHHKAAPFDAFDVDAFRMRGGSHKQGSSVPREGERLLRGDTLLRFRLKAASQGAKTASQSIAESLAGLGGRHLLFIGFLRRLAVVVDGSARVLSALPIQARGLPAIEGCDLELMEAAASESSAREGDAGASCERWLLVRARRSSSKKRHHAVALPLDGVRTIGPLWSWFPVLHVRPGLPFLLHGGDLQLTQDRNWIEDNRPDENGPGNRALLTELGQWAADVVLGLAESDSDAARTWQQQLPGIALADAWLPHPSPTQMPPGEAASVLQVAYRNRLLSPDAGGLLWPDTLGRRHRASDVRVWPEAAGGHLERLFAHPCITERDDLPWYPLAPQARQWALRPPLDDGADDGADNAAWPIELTPDDVLALMRYIAGIHGVAPGTLRPFIAGQLR